MLINLMASASKTRHFIWIVIFNSLHLTCYASKTRHRGNEMDENRNSFTDEPDGFKWVVSYTGDLNREGIIFTDMKQVSDYVGISESTFTRKLKESERNWFSINGTTITRMPYFKSKRGGSYDDK